MLIIAAALISFLLTLIAGVPYLNFLKKRLYGQFIREDGPASHAKKAGTPTMGGIIIVLPSLFASALALILDQKTSPDTFIILTTYSLFMLTGFHDDIYKILHKHNKGLSAKGKFWIQIFISLIPALYVTFQGLKSVSIFNIDNINLGYFYPIFAVLVIVGSSNAVNLTDGLDGLVAGTSAFALIAASIICTLLQRYDLAIISAAVAGSCLGFLYYNKHPAKIFMGDTGSLALGGVLGAIAVVGKFELSLLIIGLIFVIETLSVILQVISFKTTGKRIFRMSPIHHHFELLGWSEQKVVYTFWFFAIIFAITGCISGFYLTR